MDDDCESFNELPSAEATLQWVVRAWVVGHLRQEDVSARIGTALAKIGAERAQSYLDGSCGRSAAARGGHSRSCASAAPM